MGEVSDFVAALAVLGVMKVREALEEDRKSRQAEAFVPFNLPHSRSRGDQPANLQQKPSCMVL